MRKFSKIKYSKEENAAQNYLFGLGSSEMSSINYCSTVDFSDQECMQGGDPVVWWWSGSLPE